MHAPSPVTTFLFTDIEGSTRLWEEAPDRMRKALACHDQLARETVADHRGTVVKMTGDGMYAVFDDPGDALAATLALQEALLDPHSTADVELRLRCGLHAGVVEHRDHDYFGTSVNRAARIMGAAHGGQVLLSQAVATLVRERLPPGIALRELGAVHLRDLAEPEHVFQVVHPRLRQDFPALRALDATPNNLPQQVTSFIGRERELAEVMRALAGARLLTLLGTGGLGKTRLSLQVASRMLDRFPDGVWFVELAPITDERLVPQTVASVLGVKEDAGKPVLDALAKYVADRRLLLILDNCEHVLRACAEVARALLQSGRELRIVASSRESLHVSGETTYPVPSLAVPEVRESTTPGAVAPYEAVRLFVDRAVAVNPSFHLTSQNAATVAGICRRLDGIPLAIELAAARVRALSVERIAERLGERFRLLTGGDRTAPSRQQTLRASIDWSHDLLDGVERALLRRLAVFAGGWTLDAAEAVCAGGEIEGAMVLDVLAQLVEKSLVLLDADGERYAMLETVREYARERLDAAGDALATRDRHLAFYLALAETLRTQLLGPDQSASLARLDLERENLLAAHAWCDQAETGADRGLRLVQAIKQYCVNRGLLGLHYRMTVEALARSGAQQRNSARCLGLFSAGQDCCFMGRYSAATGYLEESLDIARELGDRGRMGAVLGLLGMAALGQGNHVAARGHLEEGLAVARAGEDKRGLAVAINGLAQFHRVRGALDTAEPLYAEVQALARELGDRGSVAVALLNLAMVAISRRTANRALGMLQEALSIAAETGSKPAGQSVLEVCAGLAAFRCEWETAARYFGFAEAQTEQTGLHRDPADEAFLMPLIAEARSALQPEAFARAAAAGQALRYDEAIAEARTWLAAARGACAV